MIRLSGTIGDSAHPKFCADYEVDEIGLRFYVRNTYLKEHLIGIMNTEDLKELRVLVDTLLKQSLGLHERYAAAKAAVE